MNWDGIVALGFPIEAMMRAETRTSVAQWLARVLVGRIKAGKIDLVSVLRVLQQTQAEEQALLGARWKDRRGLLFMSENGAPIHMSNLRTHFKSVLKKAGLPDIGFHDLRHTCATLLLDAGVPLITVSKILGHSSPAVTAKIYAHALDDVEGHSNRCPLAATCSIAKSRTIDPTSIVRPLCGRLSTGSMFCSPL